MDNPGISWQQHLLAVGFRCLCMVAIAMTGPLVGMDSTPERTDGSEQAPGVAGLLFVVGAVAAVIFGLIASTVHFVFRRRTLKAVLVADAVLAAVLIALMACNGAKGTRAAQASHGDEIHVNHLPLRGKAWFAIGAAHPPRPM